MNVAIFGANGPTGRLLTAAALAAGHHVTAVTRCPDAFPRYDRHLRVVGADVLDPSAVEQAMRGQQAVLSTLGVPFSRRPIEVYSRGTLHIMGAMRRCAVRRLACVSSSATQPHARGEGGFFFNQVVQPLIVNTLGKTLYADMRSMESAVRESELDWTIVRPSGLFDTATVTRYEVREDFHPNRFTSRADLADCLLRQLDISDSRRVLAVATVTEKPNMLKLIAREAFQRRPS
ncbi:MAG TPA: NAD(P)H-binding protein [Polyangiales bacterium]|nr:NAD(P)H-binding protein [Polyangiales bacterium]